MAMRQCRRLLLSLSALNRGHSAVVVGLVLTISYVIDACFFFVGGYVSDTFGRKAAAVPCGLLFGLSFFALACISSPAGGTARLAGTFDVPLFGVGVLFGLSDSFGAGLAITLQSDNTPTDAVQVLGVFKLISDLGGFAGPMIAGMLIQLIGFQMCCTAVGFVGVYSALWAYFLL